MGGDILMMFWHVFQTDWKRTATRKKDEKSIRNKLSKLPFLDRFWPPIWRQHATRPPEAITAAALWTHTLWARVELSGSS